MDCNRNVVDSKLRKTLPKNEKFFKDRKPSMLVENLKNREKDIVIFSDAKIT